MDSFDCVYLFQTLITGISGEPAVRMRVGAVTIASFKAAASSLCVTSDNTSAFDSGNAV